MAAMPMTIYSTVLCGILEALPAIDGNFWSTLSQGVCGMAVFYVLAKPRFSRDEKGETKTGLPGVSTAFWPFCCSQRLQARCRMPGVIIIEVDGVSVR